ncbi:MAG: hypothetical protein D3923_11565 [Candidatus Electrothrix sp. AR3]|nr:hypothetical protein [Candidatus Electrothrix sp. AR3]
MKKRALENYISPTYFNRINPDITMNYDSFTHMKNYSKTHDACIFLGGKKIADKHFCQQSIEEIKESFNTIEEGDEFTCIFNSIIAKI